MAKGLFDLIAAHNQQQGGYSPFDPGVIDPNQAMVMRARERLMSSPGTGPSVLGNVAGSFIGGAIKKGKAAYQARKPENKVRGHQATAVNRAIDEKMAIIMQNNPGVSPRDALAAAASDMYASTAGSKQDPEFRDMIRAISRDKLSNLGEFDPETIKKLSDAKKNLADVGNTGSIKNFFDPATKRVYSLPEEVGKEVLKSYPGLQLVDTPAAPKVGDKVVVDSGDKQNTMVYDPNQELGYGKPNSSGWVGPVSADLFAARGGPRPNDVRTESDLSGASEDIKNSLIALEGVGKAVRQIKSFADQAAAKNIPGVTGTVGMLLQGAGEAAAVIKAGVQVAREFGSNTKVYNNGTETYSQLTSVDRYEDEFGDFFSDSAALGARTKAALINLAYMLAIAEEKSARAISDNDIKLRLQTLGSKTSNPNTLKAILDDRLTETFDKVKSRMKFDPFFSDPTNTNAGFYMDRYGELEVEYLGRQAPAEGSTRSPVQIDPRVKVHGFENE